MKNLKTYENYKITIKIIYSACKYLEFISPSTIELDFKFHSTFYDYIILNCYLENVRYYNDIVKFFKENDFEIIQHDEPYNSNKIQIMVLYDKIKEYADLYDNMKKYNL